MLCYFPNKVLLVTYLRVHILGWTNLSQFALNFLGFSPKILYPRKPLSPCQTGQLATLHRDVNILCNLKYLIAQQNCNLGYSFTMYLLSPYSAGAYNPHWGGKTEQREDNRQVTHV